MGQNLYAPHELSDIRPIKFVDIRGYPDIINLPYPCPLAGYPWIPGSVDKIIILIYVHVPLYFVQT
jgi:hypothetical protein